MSDIYLWTIKIKVDESYIIAICANRSLIEFLWEKLGSKGIFRLCDSQDITIKRK
jgi:hypothetical protein